MKLEITKETFKRQGRWLVNFLPYGIKCILAGLFIASTMNIAHNSQQIFFILTHINKELVTLNKTLGGAIVEPEGKFSEQFHGHPLLNGEETL